MTRRLAPETRAARLVKAMDRAGRTVAEVIVEGDSVRLVLENGERAEGETHPFDLVDMRLKR